MFKQIASEPLETRVNLGIESIRGYLQADGGDVKLVAITPDLTVEVELLGACTACNMRDITMKAGIERIILQYAPEIARVVTTQSASVCGNEHIS